jgi:hypothetical protein
VRWILDLAKSDPGGVGAVVSATAFIVCAAAFAYDLSQPQSVIQRTVRTLTVARPGPADWVATAKPGDKIEIPGLAVSYWADPSARYSVTANAVASKPLAIVVHHTSVQPILDLVRYGHRYDEERGGSFGYHVYVDAAGRVVQGAPLSKRTNHIKPPGHAARTGVAYDVSNANTVSVTMVGACRSTGAVTDFCREETLTPEQIEAGVIVVTWMMARFQISKDRVFGHGELQSDRASFEGSTVVRAVRGNP